MKRLRRFLIITFIIGVVAIAGHIYYISTLAPTENYPEDSYLLSTPDKKALIIVAHDDDMATTAGTIALLCKNGWQIRELCFYQQGGRYFKKDSAKNPIRKKSLQQAVILQGLQGADPVDFNFRNDMETEKAYMPMPYSSFSMNYKLDSLTKYIAAYIEKYKPSVIFTLDSVIGGYGNPDHVVISQRIMDYCRKHKNDSAFSVKKIYHPVFPPSQSERVMGDMPVYNEAKKVYQCNGMPLPDVQIEPGNYAKEKKQVMQAYVTEQNSFKQISPYYNWYPYWIYFRIFDRDFFKIVDVKAL
ncbi:MAG TPA: PIG-L family deacetylase [Chitinophagaceae bacterium]